jgi:hypothetical protein
MTDGMIIGLALLRVIAFELAIIADKLTNIREAVRRW